MVLYEGRDETAWEIAMGCVGRPRTMTIEERKALIFAATERLFGERGYQKVTMSDIASAVGMSRKTLYALFKEKEELLRQLIGSSYVWPQNAADVCHGDPVEELRLRLRVMANSVLSQRHINLRRVAIAESWDIEGVAKMFHEAGIAHSRNSLIESISNIGKEKSRVDLPPELLADMLYGATCGYRLMTSLLTGEKTDLNSVYGVIDLLVSRLFKVEPEPQSAA